MWFSDHETDLAGIYKSCELCPRACRVDRTRGVPGKGPGFCGETDQLRVAHVGPHFGEEPLSRDPGDRAPFSFQVAA